MKSEPTSFRKRGRPTEDGVARRLELFQAIVPTLLERGPKMSMAQAARAAYVGVGTLYYYFGSKRELLLYGLNPEPASLLCRTFMQDRVELRAHNPVAYRQEVVGFVVKTTLVMRASLNSAISFGAGAITEIVDRLVHEPIPEFIELIASALPQDDPREPVQVEPLVRRLIAGALVDQGSTEDELVAEFGSLLSGAH